MSLHHEIKVLVPRCRACGVEPNEVDSFVQRAQEHNADPTRTMKISPQTMCYSGNNYDPSSNSFLCPPCKRQCQDEGEEDMYAVRNANHQPNEDPNL